MSRARAQRLNRTRLVFEPLRLHVLALQWVQVQLQSREARWLVHSSASWNPMPESGNAAESFESISLVPVPHINEST